MRAREALLAGEVSSARIRLVGIVAVLCVVAGCGTSEPTTSPTTTTRVVPSSSSSTTAAPTTTTSVATTPPTTVSPDVVPTAPFVDAPLDVLGARPHSEIPWSEVGEGWAMFTFGVPTGELVGDPPSMAVYQYGLYLLSPQDVIYGVVGWLSRSGLSLAVPVEDGRTAVVADAQYQPVEWLDLPTLDTTPFPSLAGASESTTSRWTAVSRDGSSLLVLDNVSGEQYGPVTRARLSRVSLDGVTWQTLVDLRLEGSPTDRSDPLSYLELGSGELVTIEIDEMWLRRADGQTVRALQLPSTECRLAGAWPDGRVLVSCVDPSRAEDCWTRGLWLVPLDGTSPAVLAVPAGEGACYATYGDAHLLGGTVMLNASHGEGECESAIEFADGTAWQPEAGLPCNAHVVGVRDGEWLALAAAGPTLESHSQPGTIYAIAPDGTSRALTPVELGDDRSVGVTSVNLLGGAGG